VTDGSGKSIPLPGNITRYFNVEGTTVISLVSTATRIAIVECYGFQA